MRLWTVAALSRALQNVNIVVVLYCNPEVHTHMIITLQIRLQCIHTFFNKKTKDCQFQSTKQYGLNSINLPSCLMRRLLIKLPRHHTLI